MRKIEIQELTPEGFAKYGQYAHMIDPDTVRIGAEPIEFYRDMVPLDLGGAAAPLLSVCRVCKRPPIIDATECHSRTGEGILPLDADVVMHVGIPTPAGEVPLDAIEVFRVHKGTFVALHPGTWHHAPFVVEADAANVLIVLPRRTYANDCEVVQIPQADRIEVMGLA